MKDSARKAMYAKNNTKTKNAIYYYINGNNATSSKYSQRDVSGIFGISEQKFGKEWKKFKEENKLIYKNGYYSFRDRPKYPSAHITNVTRTSILP